MSKDFVGACVGGYNNINISLYVIYTHCDVPSEVINRANEMQETINVTNRIFHCVLTIVGRSLLSFSITQVEFKFILTKHC